MKSQSKSQQVILWVTKPYPNVSMERQMTLTGQHNIEGEEQSWRIHTT